MCFVTNVPFAKYQRSTIHFHHNRVSLGCLQFAGDWSVRATPVPIPNTVVKPYSADGTPSERTRESRPSPAPHQKRLIATAMGRFVFPPLAVRRHTGPPTHRARPSLACFPRMTLSRVALAGAGATVAAAAVLYRREQTRR